MRKKLVGGIIAVGIAALVAFVAMSAFLSFTPSNIRTNQHPHRMRLEDLANTFANYTGVMTRLTIDIEGKPETLTLPTDAALFHIDYAIDAQGNLRNFAISLEPNNTDFYKQVGFFNRTANTVVVYPIFTQAAYDKNGFYYYYDKLCDSRCLTTTIPTGIHLRYQTGGIAFSVLTLLNYDFVTDVDVDKNPDILKKYDEVIVLHNEYVTQKEFDAITSFPNVTYLYPNALYAKITANYTNNTITLIRGHGYPDPSIGNGFGWKLDNSNYEYDVTCDNWQLYQVDNGQMLNCYPEYRLFFSKNLLRALIQ